MTLVGFKPPYQLSEKDVADILKVLHTLDQVVFEFGEDFVYEKTVRKGQYADTAQCWYVTEDGTEPSCLAGHVLYRLGVSLDRLAGREGIVVDALPSATGDLTEVAVAVLAMAQRVQDRGEPWGRARDAARDYARTLGVE
jgi:hypothetical protein